MTRSRQEYLAFTKPYLSFHRVMITRTDMEFVSDLSDLYSYKVAVQKNTSHHGFVKENSDIVPIVYSTLQESLLAVSGGEVGLLI